MGNKNEIAVYRCMTSSKSTFEVFTILEKDHELGIYRTYLLSSKCDIKSNIEKIHYKLKMFGAYQDGKDIGIKTKYIDEEMFGMINS